MKKRNYRVPVCFINKCMWYFNDDKIKSASQVVFLCSSSWMPWGHEYAEGMEWEWRKKEYLCWVQESAILQWKEEYVLSSTM